MCLQGEDNNNKTINVSESIHSYINLHEFLNATKFPERIPGLARRCSEHLTCVVLKVSWVRSGILLSRYI
jgi:hypothetical protein